MPGQTSSHGAGSPPAGPPPAAGEVFLDAVAKQVGACETFGPASRAPGLLAYPAVGSAAPATYRLSWEDGRFWVSLVTADRWLSQSIEQDLVHTGDKLEDLLSEELAEVGHDGPSPAFQHYRSEDKLFTFRVALPVAEFTTSASARTGALFLKAFEGCFRRLGDMEDKGD